MLILFPNFHSRPIMRILLLADFRLPVTRYGGTERVVWSLARELDRMGHGVTLMARQGTVCPFARVVGIDPSRRFTEQLPRDVDVAHFHVGRGVFSPREADEAGVPILTTVHGNESGAIGPNAVFVSRDHARRHGAEAFVHNGLDWDDYGPADLAPTCSRDYFHFLAKAAWRVKNVQGAIDLVRGMPGERLYVLGGTRLNFKMGFRLTLSPRVRFFGMADQELKSAVMRRSRGLLFPVRWHEPFGLAMIESLWFGAPVFGTPYGSLPELIPSDVGFLSASAAELRRAMAGWGGYSAARCHEYARDCFNARVMAERYVACYERVLAGHALNAAPGTARDTACRLSFGE